MNRLMLFSFLFGLAVPLCADEEGELQMYERPTQVGTIACREFKDSKDRAEKRVYYHAGMQVQKTVTYTYDTQDRIKLASDFFPNGDLKRTLTYEYIGNDSQRGTWRNAQGIRTYVMGHEGSPRFRTAYDLYFDDTGERLIGARGKLPSDFDLGDGWGKEVTGLSCGLGASTKQGTLNHIKLYVTIRNSREPEVRPQNIFDKPKLPDEDRSKPRGDARLPMGALYYKPRLIDKDGRAFKAGEAKHAKLNPHAFKKPIPRQIARAGKVECLSGPRPLSDWFSEIPPGDYRLLVTHPDPDMDMSLVSNTLFVTITESPMPLR